MSNFDKQLKEAITTYSAISGYSAEFIAIECVKNPDGAITESIKMIMFAAR